VIGESYKCRECGSPYGDAAISIGIGEKNALCSWCALENGDASQFLATRGIGVINEKADKRILAAQTDLHRWAKKNLKTMRNLKTGTPAYFAANLMAKNGLAT
jgi:hypothetical protein